MGKAGLLSCRGDMTLDGSSHTRLALDGRDLRFQCSDLDLGFSRVAMRLADSAGAMGRAGALASRSPSIRCSISPAALTATNIRKPRPTTGRKKDGGPPVPAAPAEALRVVVDLDRNLTLETNLGVFTLDYIITIVGTPDAPGIVGKVTTVDGYVY